MQPCCSFLTSILSTRRTAICLRRALSRSPKVLSPAPITSGDGPSCQELVAQSRTPTLSKGSHTDPETDTWTSVLPRRLGAMGLGTEQSSSGVSVQGAYGAGSRL